MAGVIIVKANGQKEEFDKTKLESSLRRAGAPEDIISQIVESIVADLEEGMTTKEIYRDAFNLLDKKHKKVAATYSLRRAVMDLGPSGFPFEQLIAEIFKRRGFETMTGEFVMGKCARHEIDVIAYNETELHLIEAKFHNKLGVKTDTKVALYVKARYDDLAGVEIDIAGQKRTMTHNWLITNTKFTKSAIEYSMCQNLSFVGWNYPDKGNLHDMITETDLHPVTILESLSGAQKKILLEDNIVLLKYIQEDSSLLGKLGLSSEKTQEVLDEIKTICVHHNHV